METTRQIFLKRYTDHIKQCPTCLQSSMGECAEDSDDHIQLCKIGAAILTAYKHTLGDKATQQLAHLSVMPWDNLAMALMGADTDPDEVWIVCLDAIIAQKVEMIWAMSECYWHSQEAVHASNRH